MVKFRQVIALGAILWAASCATRSVLDQSAAFLEEGYLKQAYEVVEAARNRQLEDFGEVDRTLEQRYQELRFEWLVAQGRGAVYADQEEKGREFLAEALSMRPGDETAQSLVVRSHRKQAARATLEGENLLAAGQMDQALEHFGTALSHVAGYAPALAGIDAVHARVGELHAEAQEQYLQAIRKLQEFRFPEVDWHAKAALKRDPERADAESVHERAMRQMAISARERGEENRREGLYGAALMQFRAAKDLVPDLDGIDDLIVATRREIHAMTLTESATLALRGDRLDEARRLLKEAFDESTFERAAINELQLAVRRRASEIDYQTAHDFEIQGMKQKALDAYRAIQAEWPDGLLDEATRVGALSSDIENCKRAYDAGVEAEKAGELDKALEEFRSAAIYYPKYADLEACIERVTAALKARAERAGAEGGSDDSATSAPAKAGPAGG